VTLHRQKAEIDGFQKTDLEHLGSFESAFRTNGAENGLIGRGRESANSISNRIV
jgi:hypothetical protein